MSAPRILKAVEYDKLSAATKKRYPSVRALYDAGWWLQRKYDGCYGMAVIWEDKPSVMLSRTGEDYTPACQHILNLLEGMTQIARGSGWYGVVYLGEVWSPKYDFPTISGMFRRQSAGPQDLQFMVNDMLPPELLSPRAYSARYEDMIRHLCPDRYPHNGAVFPAVRQTGDPEQRALEWQGEGGYDGAILRDPTAPYTIGTARKAEIVKVKPTLSLDLLVLDVLPGEGKHEGRAGALRCKLADQQFVDVGTGLSDADRERGDWVGKIVEVEAMGWSKEGKLREPRLKGIRYDKLTPDY